LIRGQAWARAPLCQSVFTEQGKSPSREQVFKENFKVDNTVVQDKSKYFKDLSWLLKSVLPEIRNELSKINNEVGSDIEIAQTMTFLRDVEQLEMAHLQSIHPIENAVVYGSTNVPLYTLITQAMLVGSFSKNVWFRTPTATREIYIKLFSYLKAYLPHEYTDNIHLVTDPSDLSYDVFNRIFVMGQSRNGNRSVRPPAELVVLTGNPDTAREMIDRNIRNLRKVAKDNPDHKQLFLGFLAGVNPSVVVPSAKENIKEVVNKLTFPFLVNGGQDCMNSDIVFVHSSIEAKLRTELLAKFRSLKMTSNTDRELGITPLTMTKSFDKLIEYKEKYKRFLVTPEASINTETKQVSPHLFVIPYKEFKDLDIQEHFAPFMTIVKYDDFEQLNQASMDPRIQKKAMFALIFGGKEMSSDLQEARNIFRQAQHGLLTNSHLYEEFEMNMPFGGIGTDTSMSVLATLQSNGKVNVLNRNRPLLISKETELVFGSDAKPKTRNASIKPLPADYYGTDYYKESRNLRTLQEVGQRSGISMPYLHPDTTPEQKKALEQLYGIRLFESPGPKENVKGIVLNWTTVDNIESNSPNMRGERNPLLGDHDLLTKVSQVKSEELRLVRAVDPKVMPGVKMYSEFFTKQEKAALEASRLEIVDLMNQGHDGVIKDADQINNKLSLFVSHFLRQVQSKLPRGAYLKNYGEYASGDLGSTVTTFGASPKQITQEFMLWFMQGQKENPNLIYYDAEIQGAVALGAFANYSRFVNALLTAPERLIIQERLDLAQTHLGQTMEFRVDFIYGKPISSRMRFGLEHYPKEMAKAKEVIEEFMAKAPAAIKTLSGGADVALTRDGRWVIFEFNFGGASGSWIAQYYPFESNAMISYLQKKPTWLLQQLDAIARLPIEQQHEFILSRKNEKPLWWRMSVEDISQLEWAKVLRDKMLDRWIRSKNKTAKLEELRTNLHGLLDNLGSNGNLDFQRLMESAEHFIQRELNN
jgi:hypothetical protein